MIRACTLSLAVFLVLTAVLPVADAAPVKNKGGNAAAQKKQKKNGQKKAGQKKGAQKKGAQKKTGQKKVANKGKSDFKKVLAKLDKDGDQELTFDEFTSGMKGKQLERARSVFDSMQTEVDPQSVGRMTVSRDELRFHFKEYQQLRAAKTGKAGKGKKSAKKPGKSK